MNAKSAIFPDTKGWDGNVATYLQALSPVRQWSKSQTQRSPSLRLSGGPHGTGESETPLFRPETAEGVLRHSERSKVGLKLGALMLSNEIPAR